MKNVLLAGGSGYLGSYIASELVDRGYNVRAIVRDQKQFLQKNILVNEVVEAEVTNTESLTHCCDGVDIVVSTIGITRQKDGLSYMDVDYQANMNLLELSKKSGVTKFIYISVLNGEILRDLKICEAKELFVEELKKSRLDYTIIRPNGFFSDMSDFYTMAKRGRMYLFSDGNLKVNPIHGADLARVCVDAIDTYEKEIKAGGPETLSHNDIARLAFKVAGNDLRITLIPEWVRGLLLRGLHLLTKETTYGPIEFFMTVMAMDMIAPEYGNHTLREYFEELRDQHEQA